LQKKLNASAQQAVGEYNHLTLADVLQQYPGLNTGRFGCIVHSITNKWEKKRERRGRREKERGKREREKFTRTV